MCVKYRYKSPIQRNCRKRPVSAMSFCALPIEVEDVKDLIAELRVEDVKDLITDIEQAFEKARR